MSSLNLTTEEGIAAWLTANTPTYAPTSTDAVQKLSGGNANFTFRVNLATPINLPDNSPRTSIVIKHAEEFAAYSADVVIPAERAAFEAAILSYIQHHKTELQPPTNPSPLPVDVPYLYHYAPESHSLILEDIQSSTTLKAALSSHTISPSDAEKIGTSLGTWLRHLHSLPYESLLPALPSKTHPLAWIAPVREYAQLSQIVSKFPLDDERKAHVMKVLGEVVPFQQEQIGKEGALCMGDFWSGNTLISQPESESSTPETTPVNHIHIIDWEMSRPANPLFDIAQFLSELFLAFHFRSSTASTILAKSFLKSYGVISEEDWRVIVMHVGVHVTCWPAVIPGWGMEEEVRRCGEVGVEWVVGAWERGVGWEGRGWLGEVKG
ncbi:hypothetical protein HDV00_004276 [Rhizophlyctis rosea]|nr:hypothetical protein HDV00_004276 [Rhizophlyctis rosea]